ncbi:MAG TPA: RHS repeat-associated core domain-containing protein [Bacteroidales bacterium]|nr:RHS repeat-associated core domain-containing protein [Bacteroidales bacterium]HOS20795.1 RHS repeat-associated core domain-containing protein [Bacteroidales bacterium]HPL02620.1 RHS repeat-associated core domain-containing protein [Bacteroidales bacterium]HRR52617.1 RHS repeat-associated core domain-containing protein [Bacteroidales bacterium]
MKIHYHSDHLGSASFVTNAEGAVVQHLQYLPYGELFVSQRNSEFDTRYKFTAKELDNETSYTYFGARYYDSDLSGWLSVDPLSDKYPSLSSYCYSADNPVVLVDPNGMDWYEVENEETQEKEIKWTDYKSQAEMDENKIDGKYLGEAVVIFKGSRDEKLGEGDNLFGKGAILAKATVYGPSNENDIKEYGAFTMSSDYKKYGAIADGEYTVNYVIPGKSGPLSSHWAVNNGDAVNCLDGINPNPSGYSETQKNGIYIHRSNNDGWAGTYQKNGVLNGASRGCLMISPNDWGKFYKQLQPVSSFYLRLERDK